MLKLPAEGDNEQARQPRDPIEHQVEHLARGRVDPVRVLEDHHDRLAARQALEPPDQRRQCPVLFPVRAQGRQTMMFRSR